MNPTRALRILVVGDSYCPSSALPRGVPTRSRTDHEITFVDVTDEPGWLPQTPSERGLASISGSPDQVIAALDGHEVLVVQGAPVTDAVLDAAPGLRLICCARGGPVNIDVAAATSPRRAGRDHAGQERRRRRRADHRVHGHARPTPARGRSATSRPAASSATTTTRARTGSATTSPGTPSA